MNIQTNFNRIGRSALAALMITSAVAGLSSCANSNQKNTKTEQPAVISYEMNDRMLNRHEVPFLSTNDVRNIFNEYGLYGGSVYLQQLSDFETFTSLPSQLVGQMYRKISKKYPKEAINRESNIPEIQEYSKTFDNWIEWKKFCSGFLLDNQGYLDKITETTQKELSKPQALSHEECSTYIDKQVKNLDTDFEQYKEKADKFKASQRGNSSVDMAEFLAYKQYLLDSILVRKTYENFGLLNSTKAQKEYENIMQYERENHQPKP